MRSLQLFLAACLLLAACAPRTPQPPPTAMPTVSASTTPGVRPTIDSTPTPVAISTAPPALTIPLPPTNGDYLVPPTNGDYLVPPTNGDYLATPAVVDAETTARHQRIFEQLWNTLNTQYVYPDFNGVDWPAVRLEFEAQIGRGLDDEAFWRAMAEMVDRLHDNHSTFLTPREAREEDDQLQGEYAYIGIGVYAATPEAERHAVILSVFPGSPAEEAGLRAHDAILAIDGQPVVNPDGTDNLDRIRGASGTSITLILKSSGEAPREVTLVRRRVAGALQASGHLLPAGTAGRRIAYLIVPTLWDATIEASTRQALSDLMAGGRLDGLIVDMRINGGGVSTNLLTLLGFFTSGRHGDFSGRDQSRPLLVSADPIGNSQDVPLIILISPETQSYAEVFSGVLREAGRAQLVGATTAGNIETIYGYDFEDGSRAWIARETFVPSSGDDWEDTGIVPDVTIDLAWDEFTEENDPYIAAALDLLAQPAGAIPPR